MFSQSSDRDPVRRREVLLSAIGIAVLAAILLMGFAAYFSPGLLLGIENLRLCF